MVERNYGLDVSRDEQVRRRLEFLYSSQTRERQIFIDDLKEYRRRKDKHMFNSVVIAVGPKWYQALSVKQRAALDSLEMSIYQDILEGRPIRSTHVMQRLGLVPCPNYNELMTCITIGRADPKEMLAQLYYSTYGYPINGKRTSYCLNARLMLSAILYLGLDNLIYLLEKTFAPDKSVTKPESKPKRKPKDDLPSPYLAKMIATLYVPPRPRRLPPPPLPDLSALNEPYEEEPVMQKPPPPPPPPPPPKKRIPISYCEKMAGINTIKPYVSPTNIPALRKPPRPKGKTRSKTTLLEGEPQKKKYGIGIFTQKKKNRRRKLVPPTTGLWNAQYTINGVFQINGKTCFVLGNISILPAQGDLIHGGYAYAKGLVINVHCGFRGVPPERKPDPCDCVQKWQDTVFRYVNTTKCSCGHNYDFGNEGTFSQDELPYFTKASRHAPLKFHYDTIFDLDSQRLYIDKVFKKVWETESVLRVDDGDDADKQRDKKKKKKKSDKDSKKGADSGIVSPAEDDASKAKLMPSQDASRPCLGMRPKITDYLKCALRLMRKVNVAARLPDLHLVPELKEWMRQRLYGKITNLEKKEYLRKSTTYWRMFSTLADKSYGHVSPPKEAIYGRRTTWTHKQSLNDTFREYTERYKLSMFRSHAYVTNLLWRTMYQAEFPDKKFREIYFSYLFSRVQDIQLIHPYSTKETTARKTILMNNRYICLPAGYEPKT